MYTFIREATFKTMVDAMRGAPIAAQIAKHYKEMTGIDVQLMRPISGSPVRLRFIGQIESLDQWQAHQTKMAQDPAFHKLLAEFGPLVDGSKTYDEIWR